MIEVPIWALSVIAIPIIAWAVYITWGMKRLVWMHDHADQTKFGTVGFRTAIDNNTRAIEALVHYVKWVAEEVTGKPPPPPTPGG